jgi:hypothetical protein
MPVPVGGLRSAHDRIVDLLEHLAHAGSHQVAILGAGIVVTSTDPRSLARVDLIGDRGVWIIEDAAAVFAGVRLHVRIVRAHARCVNVGNRVADRLR